MELLGPDLFQVFDNNIQCCDIQTCCILAMKCLKAIRDVHSIGVVHLDLLPSNFCLKKGSIDPASSDIKLIDFGLARKFMLKGKHIPQNYRRTHWTGTFQFNTLNFHCGL